MIDELNTTSQPSMASLVGDIIGDAQKLIKQQFELLGRELHLEIRRAQSAAISLGVGIVVAGTGLLLLVLALVHLLNNYTTIPLWGCYGVVGGVLVALGGGFLLFGKKEASDVALAPPPRTAETLKENWQWLKRQTTSKA